MLVTNVGDEVYADNKFEIMATDFIVFVANNQNGTLFLIHASGTNIPKIGRQHVKIVTDMLLTSMLLFLLNAISSKDFQKSPISK